MGDDVDGIRAHEPPVDSAVFGALIYLSWEFLQLTNEGGTTNEKIGHFMYCDCSYLAANGDSSRL